MGIWGGEQNARQKGMERERRREKKREQVGKADPRVRPGMEDGDGEQKKWPLSFFCFTQATCSHTLTNDGAEKTLAHWQKMITEMKCV